MKIKIITTLGPASNKISTIEKLSKNGMQIGRINMKYSSIEEASKLIEILSNLNCEVLIDVKNIDEAKKIKDLKFNYLALAFTESVKQITQLRKIFAPKKIFIIAKIETQKGVNNINNIIDDTDGVMVARGDLGNHVPIQKLPLFQKLIIKRCNAKKKFVITATEMLLSMVNSKTPTRAEVSDVANAVLDGSNAVMLSEETAIGKYPVEAVDIMRKTIDTTVRYKHILK